MIVHGMKIFVRFSIFQLYSKTNLTFKAYPKYIMQYLVMAWDNKYICTFSRRITASLAGNLELLSFHSFRKLVK